MTPQLSASDVALASCLLQPLELICQRHADPVIRELASDLRVALATRGAFCPDTVTQAARLASPNSRAEATMEKSATTSVSHTALDSQRDPCMTFDPEGGARPGHQTAAAPDSASLSDQLASSGPRVPLSSRTFSECLLEACDPDIPTRASALRTLARVIREREPEALRFREKVLMVRIDTERYWKNNILEILNIVLFIKQSRKFSQVHFG